MRIFGFFVISSVVVFSLTIFFRLGGHKSVEIREDIYPKLFLLFKEWKGPYHKISSVITEVETFARQNHIECTRTFGEYIDDPRAVDERQLRSLGGCVLSSPLKTVPPSFKFKTVESRPYVIATFSGAPSISPLKVYPKVEKYLKSHSYLRMGSIFEIYHLSSDQEITTEYLFSFQKINANN